VQFSAVEVFDYESKSVTPKYVIKSSSQVALENLAGAAEAEELPSRDLPKGGKAFDEAGFSTGILLLPPGATKELEVANFIESFYVVQAATNSLQLTLHDSTRSLSAGDHFYVPYNDTYSLKNASQNKSIELHFTLIKPSVVSNREIAQSAPATIR
jgi:mannose-6-phosphate isomerase-like protein (cupin superfamily)